MRLLSAFLRTTPDSSQFPMLVTTISTGLHQVKMQWFEQCVFAMQKGIQADPNEKASVVQTELGGSASLAITGFQLYCAGNIIEKNSYIPKNSAKGFVDMLLSRVTGGVTDDLIKHIRRYEHVSHDTSAQHFRLAVDVSRYVINQAPSMLICVHVTQLAEALSDMTNFVIADTFSDTFNVEKLRRKIKARK